MQLLFTTTRSACPLSSLACIYKREPEAAYVAPPQNRNSFLNYLFSKLEFRLHEKF